MRFFEKTSPSKQQIIISKKKRIIVVFSLKRIFFLGIIYLFGSWITGWIFQRFHRTWISLVCQSIHNYMVWNYKEKYLMEVTSDPILAVLLLGLYILLGIIEFFKIIFEKYFIYLNKSMHT